MNRVPVPSDSPQDLARLVEISCPHCGGVTTWSLLQTLNRCEYCNSVLHWPYAQGEAEQLVAESTIQTTGDMLEILATYDAMREASLQRGLTHPPNDYDALWDLGGGFSNTDSYAIKEKRKRFFKMHETHTVYVPYFLLSTIMVFHVLGRVSSGSRKVFDSFFFSSDEILPAYPPPWDFRDKGLVLSKQKLKPLTNALKDANNFLAPVQVDVDKAALTKRWTKQRKILTSEIDPISFDATAVDMRRWLVFRPYYYVNAETPNGIQWFLLDGQFGTIAGTPKTDELLRVRNKKWLKLDLKKVHPLAVEIVPFRCQHCGWDVEVNTRSLFQICTNCTRVMESTSDGLKAYPYRVISSVPWKPADVDKAVWLPYWYCRFKMNQGGKTYDDLSVAMQELVSRQTPDVPQIWDGFYVPAFESWTIDKYDHWAFQIGARLTQNGISPIGEQPLYSLMKEGDSILPPSISNALIPGLFPRLLPRYLPSSAQFRLSTMTVNRVAQKQIQMSEMLLVYVAVPLLETERRLIGPEGSVEWLPLKSGQFPPGLYRTARRWLIMAEKKGDASRPGEHKKFNF